MEVRVTAASRLHFGLLNLPAAHGSGRSFGGVGLMVEQPGLALRLAPANTWFATGPLAERSLAFARSFVAASAELSAGAQAFHMVIESAPPDHVGLGTGTQLGLAVAKGLAAAYHLDLAVVELAQRVGRGERSGLGIHGFAQGGFLVDGGKGPRTGIAPLISRTPFPDDWRIVLVIPNDRQGLHGAAERRAFAEQANNAATHADVLCRLVLLGLLPALAEEDLPAFGAALFEFNRRVGETFRPWQGGVYANPGVAALVQMIRDSGVAAVGQSSWGPTVFAVTDSERARHLANDLKRRLSETVLLTAAANFGAASGKMD